MILTAAAALFGAFLGTSLGSRLWAVLAAVGVAGFTHALLVLTALGWIGSGGDMGATQWLLSMAGAEPSDLAGTVVAAALSALFAGLLSGRGAKHDRRRRADAAFDRAAIVGPSGQRTDVLLMNR